LALHVSGEVFAHNQKHLTIFTVSGSVHQICWRLVSRMSWKLIWDTSRQQRGWTLPDTVNTVKCTWWWAKKIRPKHVEPTWNNKLIQTVHLVGYFRSHYLCFLHISSLKAGLMEIFRKKSEHVSPPTSNSWESSSKLGPKGDYLENFCRLYASDGPEEKLVHISVRRACLRAAIWTRDLSNTKQTVLKTSTAVFCGRQYNYPNIPKQEDPCKGSIFSNHEGQRKNKTVSISNAVSVWRNETS
jgi:hypothetical protein